MPKVNMESLLPFIEEAFGRNLSFQIPITGTSMNPLLYQNRDFVKIVKPTLPLAIGDIPLYRRADGSFVLHRVVGIKDNGEYVMCGDNQFLLEYGIFDGNIIGIAKTLIIDGKEIDVDTNEDYLKHKEKFIKNIKSRYPVRRLRYKLHNIKEKIFNTGKDEKTQQTITVNEGEVSEGIVAVGNILIEAIKSNITKTEFTFPEDTDFQKLYKMAQSHRVTALVAPEVMKCNFASAQAKNAFSKELFKTSVRYTAQEREREELSKAFSEAKIRHCFLKGTKVGAYYENPDSRFMLDMDLYVEPERFSDAEKILISRGYEFNGFSDDKDTGYIKKPFLIVELHKELKYDYDKGYSYYKGAFERMVCTDRYAMNMTNEDFYVYILSHTAHHFEVAGTGIKSIVDHYYLKKNLKPECDQYILEKALKEIGLDRFSEKMDNLCNYWFGDGESDPIIEQASKYIILSGVFGNESNHYINGIIRGEYTQTKKSYFLKRLFPSLKEMKIRYTVLKTVPILLPLLWGVRIITSLFNPKQLVGETKTVLSVEETAKDDQICFFKNIGL